ERTRPEEHLAPGVHVSMVTVVRVETRPQRDAQGIDDGVEHGPRECSAHLHVGYRWAGRVPICSWIARHRGPGVDAPGLDGDEIWPEVALLEGKHAHPQVREHGDGCPVIRTIVSEQEADLDVALPGVGADILGKILERSAVGIAGEPPKVERVGRTEVDLVHLSPHETQLLSQTPEERAVGAL